MSDLQSGGSEKDKRKKRAALASGRFELAASQLNAVLNNAVIGLTVSDLNEAYVFVNDIFAAMLGYEASELTGRSFRDIMHPDDLSQQEVGLAELGKVSAVVDSSKRYLHKTGGIVWVKETLSYIRERGNKDFVAAIVQDITAEHDAREEERRLRFLTDNSSDYVSLADSLGQISYMNKAGRKMVGLRLDAKELGNSVDYACPDELDRLLREVLPSINERGFWEGRMKLRHIGTGEEIPVHVKSLQIRDSTTF